MRALYAALLAFATTLALTGEARALDACGGGYGQRYGASYGACFGIEYGSPSDVVPEITADAGADASANQNVAYTLAGSCSSGAALWTQHAGTTGCTFADDSSATSGVTCTTTGAKTLDLTCGGSTTDSMVLTVGDSLDAYPSLLLADIPFTFGEVPMPSLDAGYDVTITTGADGDAWPGCTTCGKLALQDACEAGDTRIRITANFDIGTNFVDLTDCANVEFSIADTVVVTPMFRFYNADTVNIHGEGPTSSFNAVVFGSASTGVTLDSLLLYDTLGLAYFVRVDGACSHCGILHSVARGNDPVIGNAHLILLGDGSDGFLVANTNAYVDGEESTNDWLARFASTGIGSTAGAVFVDSHIESASGVTASQPILRYLVDLLVQDSTVVQLSSEQCRGLADVTGGATGWHLVRNEMYAGTPSGTNALSFGGDQHHTSNHWHTDATDCLASDAVIAALEATAGVTTGQYRGGTTTYDTNNSRPTPPSIVSPRGFTLDAQRNGGSSGDPTHLPN